MKIVRHAKVLWVGLLLLAGCKGFFNVPSNNGGCTTNCSTLSSGVFYVLNSNAGQVEIAGYSIVSGTLTSVTGSPYTLPSGPHSLAVAPNGNFLYVGTQSGIFLYKISSGGGLTLASSTALFSDFSAATMQVDSTDSWLIEASGSGYLYAIPINSADGTKSTTGTVQQLSLGVIPTIHELAISPDNKNIFVALGGVGTAVIPFNANPATGAGPLSTSVPTPIAVKSTGGTAVSVAVDPINRLFYIGELLANSGTAVTNTGGLRVFNYSSLSTGAPSELTGSPFASGGITPISILPTANGSYVYVANSTVSNSTTGNISGFQVSSTGTTYSVAPLSTTAAAGTTPAALAEDSTGTVILLVNSGGSPDLAAYTFDATTAGKLDSALTSATGTDPVGASAIAALP
jgi:6-phosphogluconolactonase (cycloisomerase 2 family)